ncbi:IS630 family transposase [Bathymodiolus japonicus methanotrophic gill symbiont]|uniref:IS630 family transposase n=1 Tax=Bathymodiolus japonicus methanotrophic gill symbiont TaxID=113269 RepID=UPI001C8DB92F|nr:IS630 family transposase [Bathymodiolus japonicus methanotrophic gill symbiont]
MATALKLSNICLCRLTQALLWFSECMGIKEIARLMGVCEKTIINWLKTFMHKGVGWLIGQHYQGRGRKSKLTKDQKNKLVELIKKGPEDNGFHCGIWNTAMIAELIWLKFEVRYNLNYLSSLMKKLGFSYQKARFVTDRQEEEKYELERKTWLEETLPAIMEKAVEEKSVVLFGDEVSFAMWGSLARTWAPIGEQPTVKTSGIRKGLKMFGTIELEGGSFQYRESLAYEIKPKSLRLLKEAGLPQEFLAILKSLKNEKYPTQKLFMEAIYSIADNVLIESYKPMILQHAETSGRFNGESYVEFLTQLLAYYKGKIILIEDGAPYHGSGVIKEFKLANVDRLTVERLPAFSPDFNPIEKLWKNTKRDSTHMKYFKTFEDLHDSVVQTFNTYMHDASKVICVMQKLREDFVVTA